MIALSNIPEREKNRDSLQPEHDTLAPIWDMLYHRCPRRPLHPPEQPQFLPGPAHIVRDLRYNS